MSPRHQGPALPGSAPPAVSSPGRDGAEPVCSNPPGASSGQSPPPQPLPLPTSGSPPLLGTLQARIIKTINTRVYGRRQAHGLPLAPRAPSPSKILASSSFPPLLLLLAVGNPWRRGCGFSVCSFFPARVLPSVPLPPAASPELAAFSARQQRSERLQGLRGAEGGDDTGEASGAAERGFVIVVVIVALPLNGKKKTRGAGGGGAPGRVSPPLQLTSPF